MGRECSIANIMFEPMFNWRASDAELLKSLTSCKQMSWLDLSYNTIDYFGIYLAHSIASWGQNTQLQGLNLSYCSIPEQVWTELFQSLSSCKQLSHLNLWGNTIGEAGHQLVQSIRLWGTYTPLQVLRLAHCSIPVQVWAELFQSISSCLHF